MRPSLPRDRGWLRGPAFATATAARATTAGFLAIDTTGDRYLSLAVAATAGADVVYHSSIEVVSY